MNSTSNVVFGKKSRVQKCGEWARAHPLKAASIALLLVLLAIVVIIEGWALYKRYPFQIPSATVTTVVAQPNTKAAEPAKPEKAEGPKPWLREPPKGDSTEGIIRTPLPTPDANRPAAQTAKATSVATKPQDVPDARRELTKSVEKKKDEKKPSKAAPKAPEKAAKVERKASEWRAIGFDPNAPCTYSDRVEWKNWGAHPYASPAKDALSGSKLDWFLKCAPLPETVKPKVRAAILAKPEGERMAYITPDLVLPAMASGPDAKHPHQHLMRDVSVARIAHSLGVVLAAEAPSWSVQDEDGTVYVIGDPLKCGNLSIIRINRVPKASCATVAVRLPPGVHRSIRYTLTRREEVSDFNCWGVIDRQWRSGAPRNCDWCEWTVDGIREMQRRYGGVFRYFHTAIYYVHSDTDLLGKEQETEVTLVFPLAAREAGVSVCVEVDGKIVPAYLILPESWEGRAEYRIPQDFFFAK